MFINLSFLYFKSKKVWKDKFHSMVKMKVSYISDYICEYKYFPAHSFWQLPLFFFYHFAVAKISFKLDFSARAENCSLLWRWLSSTSAGKLFVLFLHFCLINFTKQRAVVRVYDTLASGFYVDNIDKMSMPLNEFGEGLAALGWKGWWGLQNAPHN